MASFLLDIMEFFSLKYRKFPYCYEFLCTVPYVKQQQCSVMVGCCSCFPLLHVLICCRILCSSPYHHQLQKFLLFLNTNLYILSFIYIASHRVYIHTVLSVYLTIYMHRLLLLISLRYLALKAYYDMKRMLHSLYHTRIILSIVSW